MAIFNPNNYSGIFVNATPSHMIHTIGENKIQFLDDNRDLEFQFTHNQVLYSTSNPLHANAAIWFKITDDSGAYWLAGHTFQNGSGGEALFDKTYSGNRINPIYKESINFPLTIEAIIYSATGHPGPSSPIIYNFLMNSDSGNISDPNNDLIQTPKLPDFKIQTNDTHLLYSTYSILFKNYSQVNVKITDSIGNQ